MPSLRKPNPIRKSPRDMNGSRRMLRSKTLLSLPGTSGIVQYRRPLPSRIPGKMGLDEVRRLSNLVMRRQSLPSRRTWTIPRRIILERLSVLGSPKQTKLMQQAFSGQVWQMKGQGNVASKLRAEMSVLSAPVLRRRLPQRCLLLR